MPLASRVVTALTAPPANDTSSINVAPFVLEIVRSALPPPAPVCVMVCAPVEESATWKSKRKAGFVTVDSTPK